MSCIERIREHVRGCRLGDSLTSENEDGGLEGKTWSDDVLDKYILEALTWAKNYSHYDFAKTKEITLQAGCLQTIDFGQVLAVLSVNGDECRNLEQDKASDGVSSDGLEALQSLIKCSTTSGDGYAPDSWSLVRHDPSSFEVSPRVPDSGTNTAKIAYLPIEPECSELCCSKFLNVVVNYTLGLAHATDTLGSTSLPSARIYFRLAASGMGAIIGKDVDIHLPEEIYNKASQGSV